jgi:hypothetical protein
LKQGLLEVIADLFDSLLFIRDLLTGNNATNPLLIPQNARVALILSYPNN